MKERDKYKKLYTQLQEYEKEKKIFTKKELASTTNYEIGSIGVYIRNKLKNIYVFEDEGSGYIARNISSIDYPSFRDFMSQKSRKVQEKSSLLDSLLIRSIEAFYTSITIYNNPLIEYKVESFCIIQINAWELLLKAHIIKNYSEKEIYRDESKTISFIEAVRKVFSNEQNPLRKNLEALDSIRDKAVHLLVPENQTILSRLYQSSIFNFLKFIQQNEYPNPYAKDLPGLMSFITSMNDIDDHIISIKYGDVTLDEIKKFKEKIVSDEQSLNDMQFIIPIGYKLVLTKDEKEGDLRVTTSKSGDSAVFIRVPKDNNKTHPFRSTDVIRILNERFGSELLNRYIFMAIISKEKIRNINQNQYYFKLENPVTHKYSEALIDMIYHKIVSHDNYIENAKEYYKKERRNKT